MAAVRAPDLHEMKLVESTDTSTRSRTESNDSPQTTGVLTGRRVRLAGQSMGSRASASRPSTLGDGGDAAAQPPGIICVENEKGVIQRLILRVEVPLQGNGRDSSAAIASPTASPASSTGSPSGGSRGSLAHTPSSNSGTGSRGETPHSIIIETVGHASRRPERFRYSGSSPKPRMNVDPHLSPTWQPDRRRRVVTFAPAVDEARRGIPQPPTSSAPAAENIPWTGRQWAKVIGGVLLIAAVVVALIMLGVLYGNIGNR